MRRPALTFVLRVYAAAVVATLGTAGAVSAATPPNVMLADGTIRYEFGRRPAPALVCKPHYVCDITLDSGESVLNMAIGDAARWVIAGGQSGPSGSTPHVFVKPTQPALDTNLVITTSKRVYDIALRSEDDAKHGRISFFYADEDAAAKAVIAERQRVAIETVLAGTPLVGTAAADAKYKIGGDASVAPDGVFNDGVRTFFQWKARPNELPQVVAIAKDGTAQPVNFRIVGNRYVVDSLNAGYDLVLAASTERHGRPERRASIRHL